MDAIDEVVGQFIRAIYEVSRMKQSGEHATSNFSMGQCWCDVSCKHGHPVRMMNIKRNHYIVCDTCRTFVWIGSNLSSIWRYETDKDWSMNIESVDGMMEVAV